MLPVLFSVGPIAISSFGFFLAVAFLLATFLVWRLARAHDFDEEKVLDILILTFFGGLLGARIYFVLEHWDFFTGELIRSVLITKYPGLSFWGAFLGGWLTLFVLTKRFKVDFAAVSDIAAVGFLGGMVLGNLGCLLGGCDVGIPSKIFMAVDIQGAVGKRFPVAGIEAVIFFFMLLVVWPKAVQFHFRGKILSQVLMMVGMTKLIMQFLRPGGWQGYIFSAVLIIMGFLTFYSASKRQFKKDLVSLGSMAVKLVLSSEVRKQLLSTIWRSCYNGTLGFIKNKLTEFKWFVYNVKKKLRRFNVKPTPKDIKYN